MSKKNVDQQKLRAEIYELYIMMSTQRGLAEKVVNSPIVRGHADYTEILLGTNANTFVPKLLAKVDKWLALQETGTDDYRTGVLMKASAIHLKLYFETSMSERLRLLNQALELVEPYAETPKGFYLYMNTKIVLFECDPDRTSVSSKEMLEKSNELLTRFLSTCNEPIWECHSLFSGKPPTVEVSKYEKEYISDNLKYCLYTCYNFANDNSADKTAKILEYVIPSLRFSVKTMNPARTFTCLLGMADIVKHVLYAGWFKQLDHCLAGMMFHAVKYRRSLPKSERKVVSKIQENIALHFYSWGYIIAMGSMQQMQGEDFATPLNDKYEEIKEFKEPGVEIYAHQFPIDYVDTIDEVKQVIKRAKMWEKRTNKLCQETGGSSLDSSHLVNLESILSSVLEDQQGGKK